MVVGVASPSPVAVPVGVGVGSNVDMGVAVGVATGVVVGVRVGTEDGAGMPCIKLKIGHRGMFLSWVEQGPVVG